MNPTLKNEIEEFWNERLLEVGTAKRIKSIELPPMRLKIFSNELDSSCKSAYRPVIAIWSDDRGIVAYAEAVLVGHRRSGQVLDATSFLVEMDVISQASYEFAEILIDTHVNHNPFESARSGARWVVDFRLLEVHPSRLGQKIGVRLGAQFLNELRTRFEIGFFVLKPYPLQYSRGDGPREVQSAEEHPEQFQQDFQKLKKLYCDSWGATAFPGTDTHLFVSGSTCHRLVSRKGETHWLLDRL